MISLMSVKGLIDMLSKLVFHETPTVAVRSSVAIVPYDAKIVPSQFDARMQNVRPMQFTPDAQYFTLPRTEGYMPGGRKE